MMDEQDDKTCALPGRRLFLFQTMALTLSGTAVALLAGRPRLARAAAEGEGGAEGDVTILNAALASEQEAVAAYGVGGGSGLLQPATLKVAQQFRGHHEAHAALLAATVEKLGGKPVEAPSSYDFPVANLKTEADVLDFAAGLERGAVTAYAGAIPRFHQRELSQAAASILADEAMHWAVLRNALGLDPVPGAFFS